MLTHDGRELMLRSIESGDIAAMQRCFTRLSSQDIRRRFLHAMSELPDPMAQRMCRIDPIDRIGLRADGRNRRTGRNARRGTHLCR